MAVDSFWNMLTIAWLAAVGVSDAPVGAVLCSMVASREIET